MTILTNTTFIIPVFIESEDRLNNTKTVLGYLNNHFNTNVKIHEITQGETKLPFIDIYKNLNIEHIIEKTDVNDYHRTRQLNEMLNVVKTPVVVNYDIDVLLPIETYINASNMILKKECDIVYPYGDGMFQKRVFNQTDLNKSFNLGDIKKESYDIWNAKYGHCIFLNTKKYKQSGGENENFIAYGPEDVERYERFIKIGYNVKRINNYIYHLEHSRTAFSNNLHSNYNNNNSLYSILTKLSKEDTINYYNNIDYIKKYKNFNNANI